MPQELEEERAGRQEALLARDASSAELRRAQRSAEDERRRHKAAERRLQAENEELYQVGERAPAPGGGGVGSWALLAVAWGV